MKIYIPLTKEACHLDTHVGIHCSRSLNATRFIKCALQFKKINSLFHMEGTEIACRSCCRVL